MWEIIINIVLAVLSVVLALVGFYLDTKKKVLEQTNTAVADAEKTDKDNAEKMAFVVERLKAIIPKALRFIFTDAVIEKIAQAAFDKIKEYAVEHAKKK